MTALSERRSLAERLRTAQCPITLNGNWQEAGNFTAALEIVASPDTDDEAKPRR